MKTIIIRQPWASLICDKEKQIKTRSWKTNYRGPLYIHAGTYIPTNKDLEKISYKKDELVYGAIIVKCKLIDCVLMDENFIEKIKKNKK